MAAKGTQNGNLYKEVVEVTYRYLGPASDRFVGRQVSHHLNKEPHQLCEQDLAVLINWFSLAMATVSEDIELVKSYTAELNKLCGDKGTIVSE